MTSYSRYTGKPNNYDPNHSYLFFRVKSTEKQEKEHPIKDDIKNFIHHFKEKMDHLHDSVYKIKEQSDHISKLLDKFTGMANKVK